jgi:hypothetical protein
MKFKANPEVVEIDYLCAEQNCAWYDEPCKQCAILSIAEALRPEWD